ncbi:hypothetical protein CURTO8I2_250209 [Curtobacterium sp. 8I-2]|nr:hypothetical protein CURTO8I2_250209 [Curtobacterium sp. 8I-2]
MPLLLRPWGYGHVQGFHQLLRGPELRRSSSGPSTRLRGFVKTRAVNDSLPSRSRCICSQLSSAMTHGISRRRQQRARSARAPSAR